MAHHGFSIIDGLAISSSICALDRLKISSILPLLTILTIQITTIRGLNIDLPILNFNRDAVVRPFKLKLILQRLILPKQVLIKQPALQYHLVLVLIGTRNLLPDVLLTSPLFVHEGVQACAL